MPERCRPANGRDPMRIEDRLQLTTTVSFLVPLSYMGVRWWLDQMPFSFPLAAWFLVDATVQYALILLLRGEQLSRSRFSCRRTACYRSIGVQRAGRRIPADPPAFSSDTEPTSRPGRLCVLTLCGGHSTPLSFLFRADGIPDRRALSAHSTGLDSVAVASPATIREASLARASPQTTAAHGDRQKWE